jgi:hypothetical protein
MTMNVAQAPHERPGTGKSPSRHGVRQPAPVRTWVLALALTFSLAMLLWLKLRVVTGVPRSAYADPEATNSQPAQPVRPDSPTP